MRRSVFSEVTIFLLSHSSFINLLRFSQFGFIQLFQYNIFSVLNQSCKTRWIEGSRCLLNQFRALSSHVYSLEECSCAEGLFCRLNKIDLGPTGATCQKWLNGYETTLYETGGGKNGGKKNGRDKSDG